MILNFNSEFRSRSGRHANFDNLARVHASHSDLRSGLEGVDLRKFGVVLGALGEQHSPVSNQEQTEAE